jgi:hypothetical protein
MLKEASVACRTIIVGPTRVFPIAIGIDQTECCSRGADRQLVRQSSGAIRFAIERKGPGEPMDRLLLPQVTNALSQVRQMKIAWSWLALLLLATPAFADVVNLNPNMFGHLNQNDPALAGVCAAGGVNYACGPVAAVNSFVFLQNSDREIYDTTLTGDPTVNQNLVNTAITLSGNQFMMCAACSGGTSINNFISGKMAYIEGLDKLAGKTAYADQTNFAANQNPTRLLNFLFSELRQNEDVELLFGYYNADGTRDGGHYVTLYGLSGGTDPMTLSFVDPNGRVNMPNIGYTINGNILSLPGYGPGGGLTTRIDWAVAESPVPEPATFLIIGVGLILIAVGYRSGFRLLQRT